jgi:hypothetical protein
MLAAYTALRAYQVTAINTAWSGVTVVKAQDGMERPGEFARINLDGEQGINTQNGSVDEVEFNFVITGRFTLASGGDAELLGVTKVDALRTALLASKHPGAGEVGYLPHVGSFSVEAVDGSDNRYDVRVPFRCMALTARP